MIASGPLDILHFLHARQAEGQETVLVTLVGLEGSSSRAIGAQMAVTADGTRLGSFSAGCVEAAVVAEALEALGEDQARQVRFGANSPYLDIRLPCGGGVDLLFNPNPNPAAIRDVLAATTARKQAGLRLSLHGVSAIDATSALPDAGWTGEFFTLRCAPALRIAALGQGEDLTALARLADRFGAEIIALSPESGAISDLSAENIKTRMIVRRHTLPPLETDPWTAIVFLFHDRDWEDGLLPAALRLPAFYIGAVGSRRTHAARLDNLRALGVSDRTLEALRGPIGLIPATRDPATLALSILSEVVSEYNLIRCAAPAARHEHADLQFASPDVRSRPPRS